MNICGRVFRSILLLALFLVPASRADECPPHVDYNENYRDLIHKIAVIDEDGRRTEEKYAQEKYRPLAEIQNRFAATGVLNCNGFRSSAQLTGAKDVLTTTAHTFINTDSCKKKNAPESCTFTVKVGTVETVSRVKRAAEIGITCPNNTGGFNDWAVLQLENSIEGVKPYEVPFSDEPISAGNPVIAVAGLANDFGTKDPRTKKRILPKSIEECTIKNTTSLQTTIQFESNCDSGSGSSGGSVLRRVNGNDVLLGITTSNDETGAAEERAIKGNTVNSGIYRSNEWATYHVPVKGRFLKAIESATGGRSL